MAQIQYGPGAREHGAKRWRWRHQDAVSHGDTRRHKETPPGRLRRLHGRGTFQMSKMSGSKEEGEHSRRQSSTSQPGQQEAAVFGLSTSDEAETNTGRAAPGTRACTRGSASLPSSSPATGFFVPHVPLMLALLTTGPLQSPPVAERLLLWPSLHRLPWTCTFNSKASTEVTFP